MFMCRIASLFLLQRLKVSMSGDAGDFNNMETRPVIKIFFFPARQNAEGNTRHSDRNIRGTCTIACHRQKLGGRGKVTNGVLFLHDIVPAHRALQPRRNWPTWASNVLITHPILRIWPRRTAICSLDWKKKQLKGCDFSSDAEPIAAAETWLDGQPSEFFLSGLQKLEQRAKKCIEFRGKYVK